MCTTAKLAITHSEVRAASGRNGLAIIFRNVGPTECWISGYPGVDSADSSGHAVVEARRTRSGYLGGQRNSGPPAVIYLGPKELASALVEGTFGPSASSCGSFVALVVTPPGETHSVTLSVSLPTCSRIQVHPVVAGPTGNSG